MSRDFSDNSLGTEVLDGLASNGSADLKSIRNNRYSDQLVGGDFLKESFMGFLIEEYSIVGELLLCASLGPTLLSLVTTGLNRCKRDIRVHYWSYHFLEVMKSRGWTERRKLPIG